MGTEIRELMRQGARDLGVQLNEPGTIQVEWLTKRLLRENERFNLTALKTEEEVIIKHFLDAWAICPLIGSTGKLIDIGSGAGFPGLAIKVVRPQLEITMVEAIHKKVGFITGCIQELQWSGIQALTGRAEEIGREANLRASFDFATSRAVGHLAEVAEYCLPLLINGGLLVAPKGPEGNTEAAEAAEGIKELGGQIEEVRWISYPMLPGRCLISIRKTEATPDRYPRRVGIPHKRPLISKVTR